MSDKIFPTLSELTESLRLISNLEEILNAIALRDCLDIFHAWASLGLPKPTGYIFMWLHGLNRDLKDELKRTEEEALHG